MSINEVKLTIIDTFRWEAPTKPNGKLGPRGAEIDAGMKDDS